VNRFDKKFGKDFFYSIPDSPGVYFFCDENGIALYVGKAKNLRRRLNNYRNAKRRKRHAKMRDILDAASTLRWEVCETDLEASVREIRLIQSLKPPRNISSKFSFMYPLIGLKRENDTVYLLLTTLPEKFPGYSFYGCFRSRRRARDGFFGLIHLLPFLGHPVPKNRLGKTERYSYLCGFRRLPPNFLETWTEFFKGNSKEALEDLSMHLLEKPGARAKAEEVQENLYALRRFWRFEATLLARAMKAMDWKEPYVAQHERDLLFLQLRHQELSK
jgi:excinuclease UvrABC nuclease subunit